MQVSPQELEQLVEIATSAGKVIMEVYDTKVAVWRKSDASPVTKADLRSDEVIRAGLEAKFPGLFILSEESSSTTPRDRDNYFLVDPLDGTKEFLKHNDEFTVNIALLHRDRPVAGVVFAPALNELFYGTSDAGAWKRTEAGTVRMKVTPFGRDRPLRVIQSRSHGSTEVADGLAKLGFAYVTVEAGSSLKFCRIAEGRADLYPRFGPTSQWDTAAAQCVLEAAGGSVLKSSGQPLRYGLDHPILNPAFLALGDSSLAELARTLHLRMTVDVST